MQLHVISNEKSVHFIYCAFLIFVEVENIIFLNT